MCGGGGGGGCMCVRGVCVCVCVHVHECASSLHVCVHPIETQVKRMRLYNLTNNTLMYTLKSDPYFLYSCGTTFFLMQSFSVPHTIHMFSFCFK